MSPDLTPTHAAILALQAEMRTDSEFERLCRLHGLPWDFVGGYEPRWYNGPAPEQVAVLVLMAEPGAITTTEREHLLPAITHEQWLSPYDLRLQEHYWRENLRALCAHIWPLDTERAMFDHLGGSCTFWMSLPPGAQTSDVPAALLRYFLPRYLVRFLSLFSNATIVAAGAKARDRLRQLGVPHESCWAFTRPGCNQPAARESWRAVGCAVRERPVRLGSLVRARSSTSQLD
jgi:hypothetical protein